MDFTIKQMPYEKVFRLNFSAEISVDQLKEIIEVKEQIAQENQVLVFRNKILKSGRTVKSYNIQENEIILLYEDENGDDWYLDPENQYNFQKIEESKFESSSNYMRMSQSSNQSFTNSPFQQDGSTIQKADPGSGDSQQATFANLFGIDQPPTQSSSSVMQLREIFIQPSGGEIFPIDVELNGDSVLVLKTRISKQIGIPFDLFELKSQNILMINEKLVSFYGVEQHACLTIPTIEINSFVVLEDGSSFQLNINPFDQILDIQKQIFEKTQIEPEKQKISVGIYEFTDTESIIQYPTLIKRDMKINLKVGKPDCTIF